MYNGFGSIIGAWWAAVNAVYKAHTEKEQQAATTAEAQRSAYSLTREAQVTAADAARRAAADAQKQEQAQQLIKGALIVGAVLVGGALLAKAGKK